MQVAYFYLDPTDALRELRVLRTSQPDARLKLASLAEVYFPLVLGDPKALGGSLRLRPSRRQIVNANRALQVGVRPSPPAQTQCRNRSACTGPAPVVSASFPGSKQPRICALCVCRHAPFLDWRAGLGSDQHHPPSLGGPFSSHPRFQSP